jgi:hypothetical protein
MAAPGIEPVPRSAMPASVSARFVACVATACAVVLAVMHDPGTTLGGWLARLTGVLAGAPFVLAAPLAAGGGS